MFARVLGGVVKLMRVNGSTRFLLAGDLAEEWIVASSDDIIPHS